MQRDRRLLARSTAGAAAEEIPTDEGQILDLVATWMSASRAGDTDTATHETARSRGRAIHTGMPMLEAQRELLPRDRAHARRGRCSDAVGER